MSERELINKRSSKSYLFLNHLGIFLPNATNDIILRSLETPGDQDRSRPVFEEDLSTWKLFSNMKRLKTDESIEDLIDLSQDHLDNPSTTHPYD